MIFQEPFSHPCFLALLEAVVGPGLCSGGHVGGQDVVGVTVKILAGPVLPHRRAWISMAGRDLNIPQVHPGVQHGRNERVAEHMRMWPGYGHPGGFSQVPKTAGRRVAVHPDAAPVEQDRPGITVADGPVDRPPRR